MSRWNPEIVIDEDRWKAVRFTLFAIVGMLLLNIPATVFHLGWQSAAFNTALVLVVFIAYAAKRRDAWLFGWIVFGLVAGVVELGADWWLVHDTKTLVYAADEPMILASPVYMPGAWAEVLMQLGILGYFLRSKFPMWVAILATSLIAGVNIPLYESFAKGADWWIYENTPMILDAPWYIILGEALLGPVLVWFAVLMHDKPLQRCVPLGIAMGLWIFVAYWLAWILVGPCDGALIQLPCTGA